MGIWYKYAGYVDQLSDAPRENKVRPVAISKGNKGSEELVARIVANNYYSAPDAHKAVDAVFRTIEELLRDGYTVTIDGYGTFQPSLHFVPETVDNSDPEKKVKSIDLRAESIEVKAIAFRATAQMKKRVGVGNIERMPKEGGKKRGR